MSGVGPASWTTTGHVYEVGNEHDGDPAACSKSGPSSATTANRPSAPKSLMNAASAYRPQLPSLLALFFWDPVRRPRANPSGLVSAGPEAPIYNTNKPPIEATTLVAPTI